MENQELKFPVVYNLRIIYKGSAQEGINKVERLLKDLAIDCENSIEKAGGKSRMCRLSFTITLTSRAQMDTLYSNLNTIPEIKWAT